ncbi:MAG: RluA family pseudouridine synthase [Flavobacteriales bacterium]
MSSTEPGAAVVLLHVDEHLCVAWKPGGMPVQPDPTGDPSLLELVAVQLNTKELGLVHRLDRPVSGAVVISRDADVLRGLNEQFRKREVEKRYWAIVEGVERLGPPGVEQVLEDLITRDGRGKRARISASGIGVEEELSRLRFTVLAKGERLALLEVVPEGGAFHQIRAQLSKAGFPIRGDVKYGARRGERDRTIALHARSLAFVHPITGRPVHTVAPPPETPVWQAMQRLLSGGPDDCAARG